MFCKSVLNVKMRTLSLINNPVILQVYDCSKVWHTFIAFSLSELHKRKSTRYTYTEKSKPIVSQNRTKKELTLIDFQKMIQPYHIKHIL